MQSCTAARPPAATTLQTMNMAAATTMNTASAELDLARNSNWSTLKQGSKVVLSYCACPVCLKVELMIGANWVGRRTSNKQLIRVGLKEDIEVLYF